MDNKGSNANRDIDIKTQNIQKSQNRLEFSTRNTLSLCVKYTSTDKS